MFMPPMLARPLPKDFVINPGEWWAEEKFDGIRLISEVSQGKATLFTDKGITGWSRYGNVIPLSQGILDEFQKFPDGIYDGELTVPGHRSYGVKDLDNLADRVLVLFDILVLEGVEMCPLPYIQRRATLYSCAGEGIRDKVRIADTHPLDSFDDVVRLRDEVWSRGGEGLILKKATGIYELGKRSKNLIKIKDLKSAVLRVVEFLPSRGTINDRGPCAIVLLEDEDGNRTTVKTKNDALCVALAGMLDNGVHPFIGRELRIEYQERTPDGNYRHPRWDRWEDE